MSRHLGRFTSFGGGGLHLHYLVELDGHRRLPECAHLLGDRVRQAGNRDLREAGAHHLGFDRVQGAREHRRVAGAQARAQLAHRHHPAEALTGRRGMPGVQLRLGEHREHGGADLVGGDGGGAGRGGAPAPGGKGARMNFQCSSRGGSHTARTLDNPVAVRNGDADRDKPLITANRRLSHRALPAAPVPGRQVRDAPATRQGDTSGSVVCVKPLP